MECVWVKIRCRDEDTSLAVIRRLKEGSRRDAENSRLHYAFIYAFDLHDLKKFLGLKALDYDNKWGEGMGSDIDEAEIFPDLDYEQSRDES